MKACRFPGPAQENLILLASGVQDQHFYLHPTDSDRLRLGFEKHWSRNLGSRTAHTHLVLFLKNPISVNVCTSNLISSLIYTIISGCFISVYYKFQFTMKLNNLVSSFLLSMLFLKQFWIPEISICLI